MKNFQYLLVVLFLMTVSCKKDDNDVDNPVIPGPSATAVIRIAGMVTDESGLPLPGVTLQIGTNVRGSDGNGFFEFAAVGVPAKRFFVRAFKDGFFEGGYGAIPVNATIHSVRIRLIARGTAASVSSTGGTVNVNGGAKIIFPPSAFETSSGNPMIGAASIYSRYIKPGDANFAILTPGADLMCKSANKEYPLQSFGMLAVFMADQGGMQLKLAPGKTAEVRMPIATAQQATTPATIPLVFFDTHDGLWKQEGVATKTGTEYIGTVSHFSWWNCDQITGEPKTIIQGKVVDCEGIPLAGINVTVNGQFSVVTNSMGVYANWVPPGITITAQVLGIYNGGVYSSINTVSVNPLPGTNILPDLNVPCPSSFNGNIVDCSGNNAPIYIWASWSTGNTNAIFVLNGNFKIGVADNENVTLHISNGNYSKDTILMSGNMNDEINVGSLLFCVASGATTGCSGGVNKVIDVDGNIYGVVQIGNQCWMKENLKTSRYRNGDTIEYIPRQPIVDDSIWHSRTTGAYTTIDNAVYGKLYNWYAVADSRNLCPAGWHVPNSAEFNTLVSFLGGNAVAGGALKQTGTLQAGTGLWSAPNTGATNSSEFTALPAGLRAGGTGGNNSITYFWGSTPGNITNAYVRNLGQSATTFNDAAMSRSNGATVRCIRD
jgi:uncharacterized protein (TIGR02145 family)